MINSAAAAALSAGIPFKETDKKSTRYNKADTAVIISVVRWLTYDLQTHDFD